MNYKSYHLLYIATLLIWSCSSPISKKNGNYRVLSSDINEYSYQNFERIDYRKTLFGIEYTFQDEEIVKEPGRMTMRTPHKAERFEAMFSAYSDELGLGRDAITSDTSNSGFKPGYVFTVPGDGSYTINMEPVTIEVNTTPKLIDEIIPISTKIFNAAEKSAIVPYVNSAAERSGMGHIHVGAKTLRESPLYQNPVLLRNILTYYHQHPSLLYGFAEAYDIGDESNIETFHNERRQTAFKRVVDEFDEWYLKTQREGGETSEGLATFLRILKANEPPGQGFCHHYRIINLEHLCKLDPNNLPLDREGKYTVEHRGFRPQKNPKTAHANAHLLLDLYEKLSDPSFLVPFRSISPKKFKRFWTPSILENDWKKVKSFIGHNNPYSDDMIEETVDALLTQEFHESIKVPNAVITSAFSKKEDKGKAFELRIESPARPKVEVAGTKLDFEKIIDDDKIFWIAYLDSSELNLTPEELLSEKLFTYKRVIVDEDSFSIRGLGIPTSSCSALVKAILR